MIGATSSSGIGTVALLTLGCKLNQADSETLARELAAAGCRVVDRPSPADAFVINTCSVTHVADRKSRHLVRLARRLAPQAPVVVTGCCVETGRPGLAEAVGADLALGNEAKATLVRTLLGRGNGQAHVRGGRCPTAAAIGLRTRAFVKVQEGCNDVCAFCIVPRTRGRERSVPIDEVVAAVRQREAEGVREVVLTGTQLGAYGRDLGEAVGPGDLLSTLLARTLVPRLRFSSLQPQDITPGLLALWKDSRLCRHFHLALQSGSDPVLRRMRRRYSVEEFRRAAARMREAVPDVAITTDVIVGFPGETEAEFEESYAFCREMGFARVHVFPYSRRSGTAAARMPRQVPERVKRGRVERMLTLARELEEAWLARFVGRDMLVLWERPREADDGGPPLWEGLTDNYIRVYARSAGDLRNGLLPVRLRRPHQGGFEGELLA
jgi:threonylcarbamoyladenosine tRNA methylthiotransferase MtaB